MLFTIGHRIARYSLSSLLSVCAHKYLPNLGSLAGMRALAFCETAEHHVPMRCRSVPTSWNSLAHRFGAPLRKIEVGVLAYLA